MFGFVVQEGNSYFFRKRKGEIISWWYSVFFGFRGRRGGATQLCEARGQHNAVFFKW